MKCGERRFEMRNGVRFYLPLLVFLLAVTVFAEDIGKDFNFKTLDGKTIDAASLKGKLVVINIMTSW